MPRFFERNGGKIWGIGVGDAWLFIFILVPLKPAKMVLASGDVMSVPHIYYTKNMHTSTVCNGSAKAHSDKSGNIWRSLLGIFSKIFKPCT